MGKNELARGQSRIGFAWDLKIREPYPAMLRDRDGRIELVIPFEDSEDVLRRRYLGDLINWGDDPEMQKFDYALPDHFWFADAHGFVALVGIRSRTLDPIVGGMTTLAEGRVGFTFAVFTGSPDADYAKINGLLTRIEGLGRWYGHRSVVETSAKQRTAPEEFTLTIKANKTERLAQGLNLSLLAGADWNIPGEPGKTSIAEIGAVRTSVERPRSWEDHLDKHLAIHQLLELSAWRPLGFQRVRAMHHQDPERVLSGKVIGPRWAPVQSYALPPEGTQMDDWFFFTFSDIGAAGVRRWLRLRGQFSRGIDAMTFGIRHGVGASLDGLISDSGIGLEEIGHQIDVLGGGGARRGHHAHLLDIAREVEDLLPFDAAKWATNSTDLYNDVKHADRRDPTAEEMLVMLKDNRTVFRVWVARRLGVAAETIRKNLWILERG